MMFRAFERRTSCV